jgi:hypothetical protein
VHRDQLSLLRRQNCEQTMNHSIRQLAIPKKKKPVPAQTGLH